MSSFQPNSDLISSLDIMVMDAVVMIIFPWRPFPLLPQHTAAFQRVHNRCMVKGGDEETVGGKPVKLIGEAGAAIAAGNDECSIY